MSLPAPLKSIGNRKSKIIQPYGNVHRPAYTLFTGQIVIERQASAAALSTY
ncbi:MAG: hypothetical protein ABR577_17925 [Pyrinomonadaceae bacterium]